MLINCPHCGHPIASTSPTCPHCGGLNDVFMDAVEVHDKNVDYIVGNQDRIENGFEFFNDLYNKLLWNLMIYFTFFGFLTATSSQDIMPLIFPLVFITLWFTGCQCMLGTGFFMTYGFVIVIMAFASILLHLIGLSDERVQIIVGVMIFVIPFIYTIVQICRATYGIITGKINLHNFHLTSADVYINRVRNFGKNMSTKNEDQQRQSIINDARAETGYRPEYFE